MADGPDTVPGAGTSLLSAWRLWAILLAAGSAWGLTFTLTKIATGGGMRPIGITFWQALFSIAILAAVMAVRRRGLRFDWPHLRFYLFCGFFGTALPSVLFFYAAYHLSAGVLSITISAVPILTFAMAIGLRSERFHAWRALGVVLGIVAVIMIVAPETALPQGVAAVWVLVSVAAAASYAIENMFIALRRPAASDPTALLLGMAVVALALLGPVGVATGELSGISWPLGATEYAVFAMAVINVACYGAFIFLVTASGPVFASQMAYVVTLAGVFWGIVVFDEQHSAWIWGALAVMMLGLVLVRPRKEGEGD